MCRIVAKATFILSANMMLCANKLRREGLDASIINMCLSIIMLHKHAYHIPLVVLYTKIDCNTISILISIRVYVCNVYRLQ